MIRVAVYCRVSSEAQRKERTIESQLREVPAFCVARGWTIVETYVDDGKSAATGKLAGREAFARLLADATAGRFDVVAVIAQDRLTRTTDLRERGAIMGAFQAAGVQVAIASTGQVLDLRTDAGDLLGMFGSFQAGSANRQRVADTMRGKRELVSRGGKPQGSTPIGLLYDRDREAWAIDPTWAPAIREIYERVARGESTSAIAASLAARGLKRPRGGGWRPNRVSSVVTSTTYSGRLVVHRATGRYVTVPAIVDADLAAEARAVLSDRYQRPPPRTRHPHLLAGRLRCGLCHGRVGIHGYTAAGREVHAYLCLTRRWARFGERTCELPRMPVAALDALVWREVTALLATSAIVDRAYAGSRVVAVDDAALEAARAELARIDGLIADVLAMAADGLVSREAADAQVRRLGPDRKAAQAAIREAQAARASIRPAMDRADLAERVGLLARWCADPRTTDARRSELMHALVDTAVLRPDSIAIDLRIPVETVQGATDSRSTGALSAGRLTVHVPRKAA